MREISPQEYESSLAEIEFFKDQLATKDAEIERLQADLDVWHKMALEIAGMVVEAGNDPD